MNEKQSARKSDCHLMMVGVGNGGCSVVTEMARQWKDGPAMVAINTDTNAVADVEGLRRVPIGAQTMKGMGTGGDPRVGRRAAEADVEAIRGLFQGVNLVFVVVGLGGGTGTGAAPLVVEEARKAGALTLCFSMMPFEFEGPRRMDQAKRGFLALDDVADGVICLPNQRLVGVITDRTNITEAFRKADEILCRGIQAVWRVVCQKGIINLGFADVRALLQAGSGPCVFGCAEGVGPDKVAMVLQAIRVDPVLKHGEALAHAHAYIVSIMGGKDLALKDVDALMQGLMTISRPEALAMTGVCCDPALGDKVFVTILAAEQGSESEPQGRPGLTPGEAATLSQVSKSDEERAAQKVKLTQGTLFDAARQGRFKDIDPTIVEGNNLDIPTFIRRGIMIQKVRNSAF